MTSKRTYRHAKKEFLAVFYGNAPKDSLVLTAVNQVEDALAFKPKSVSGILGALHRRKARRALESVLQRYNTSIHGSVAASSQDAAYLYLVTSIQECVASSYGSPTRFKRIPLLAVEERL